MKACGIFDTHWGDSGKGKVIAYLLSGPWAGRVAVNSRWNGGNNAGHTVVQNGKKIILRMLPSSILNPDVDSLISPMCVVNVQDLVDREMPEAVKAGISLKRLHIARETFTVMPWHLDLEKAEKEALGGTGLGSTMNGVGPAYADITARYGITIEDLLDRDRLLSRLESVLAVKNLVPAVQAQGYTPEKMTETLFRYGEMLRPYVVELDRYVNRALQGQLGNEMLACFEQAQGTMLDIQSPNYPYNTSSGTTIHDLNKIFGLRLGNWGMRIGVCKAYTTSVGRRDFPTKIEGDIAAYLQNHGGEFGSVTGRPRDCGWLDGVPLQRAVRLNWLTHLFLTKLDVLDGLSEILICTAYKRDGDFLKTMPRSGLERVQPNYQALPGWKSQTRGATAWGQLPPRAREFLRRIQEIAGIPIVGISTGPETKETIWLGD
jgi:adenylosuccinate synthase